VDAAQLLGHEEEIDKLRQQVHKRRYPNETTVQETSWGTPQHESAWGPPQPEAPTEEQELGPSHPQLPLQNADDVLQQHLNGWQAMVSGETIESRSQGRTESAKVVEDMNIASSTHSVLPVELEPHSLEEFQDAPPSSAELGKMQITINPKPETSDVTEKSQVQIAENEKCDERVVDERDVSDEGKMAIFTYYKLLHVRLFVYHHSYIAVFLVPRGSHETK
jgi:hypothetical protein